MDSKERIRQQVWQKLRLHARPDSRFAWDFNAFIPDFEGSDICTDRTCQLEKYREAKIIFVTPDNSLISLRERCIVDHKVLVIPTYGLKRGFLQINGNEIPFGQERFAATLDGVEYFGRPYELTTNDKLAKPNLLITGASVINTQGIRISNGPSYFELEWLILATLRLIQINTPVFSIVHTCQVVDFCYQPLPYCVVPDCIVTPTQVIENTVPFHRPQNSVWEYLPLQVFEEVPLLRMFYPQNVIKNE